MTNPRPLPLAIAKQGISLPTSPAYPPAKSVAATAAAAAAAAAARPASYTYPAMPTNPNCMHGCELRFKLQAQADEKALSLKEARVDGYSAAAVAPAAPKPKTQPRAQPPKRAAKPEERSNAAIRNARWRLKKKTQDAKLKDMFLEKRAALELPPLNLERPRLDLKGTKRKTYLPPPEILARMTNQELKEWRAVQRRKRKSEMQKRNRDEKRALMNKIKEVLPELVQKAEEREVAGLLIGLGDRKDGGGAAAMGGGGSQVQETVVQGKLGVNSSAAPFASVSSSNIEEPRIVNGSKPVVSGVGCIHKMSGQVVDDLQVSKLLLGLGRGEVGRDTKIASGPSKTKASDPREKSKEVKKVTVKKAAKKQAKKQSVGSQVKTPKVTKSVRTSTGKSAEVTCLDCKIEHADDTSDMANSACSVDNKSDSPHSPRSMIESTSVCELPYSRHDVVSLDSYSCGSGKSGPESLASSESCIDSDEKLDSPRLLHCHTTIKTSKGYLVPHYGSLGD
ncbi:hypothetical protein ACHAXN_012574 [Cyclotella atomus]